MVFLCPALGRWMNIDPMADEFFSWSPYNYVYNSPLAFVDSDGRLASSAYGIGTGRIFFVGPNSGGFLSGGGDTYSGNVRFGSNSSGNTGSGNASSGSFEQTSPSQNDNFGDPNAIPLKEVVVTLYDESSYTYAALNIQAQVSISEQYKMFLQYDNQPLVSLRLAPIPMEMNKPIGSAGALEYLSGGLVFKSADLIKLLKLGNVWHKGNKAVSAIQAARKMGAELVKKYKRVTKIGTNAGRSSGHGTPHKRAGNELIRLANDKSKGWTKEFSAALKKEGQRLINQGKGHNHK